MARNIVPFMPFFSDLDVAQGITFVVEWLDNPTQDKPWPDCIPVWVTDRQMKDQVPPVRQEDEALPTYLWSSRLDDRNGKQKRAIQVNCVQDLMHKHGFGFFKVSVCRASRHHADGKLSDHVMRLSLTLSLNPGGPEQQSQGWHKGFDVIPQKEVFGLVGRHTFGSVIGISNPEYDSKGAATGNRWFAIICSKTLECVDMIGLQPWTVDIKEDQGKHFIVPTSVRVNKPV